VSELAPRRLVVGITGASGAIYGIRTLELLAKCGVETHLVISKAAAAIGRRHRESHGGTVAGFVRHRRWGRAALEAIAEGFDRLGKSQDGSSACDDASRNDAPRSDGLPQNKARN